MASHHAFAVTAGTLTKMGSALRPRAVNTMCCWRALERRVALVSLSVALAMARAARP